MKKITSFKIIAVLFACFLFGNAKSQCMASFSYTVGANGSVAFTNNSQPNTSTSINYSWNFGDNQFSTQTNPTHVYAASGSYLVILQRSDSLQSCNATYSTVITVTNVACNVVAGFNFTVNPSGLVTFVNASTGTIPQTMYYLQYGDNSSSNFPNNSFNTISHSYANSGNYTATLTAFNNSVTCFASYTANINVTVQPCTLTAGFTYTVNNGTVNFSNTSTGVSPTAFQYWNFGNSNTFFGANPPTQSYNANGSYSVTLYINDSITTNCSSSITHTFNITNAPCIATANFYMAKDTSMMPSIVWNAYPFYPSNVSSVVWNWGDNSSSTGLYPSHTYSATGFYNICLTVSVSCGSSTTTCINQNIFKTNNSMQMAMVNVLSASPTGIAKNNVSAAAIRLYPNPVKDVLTIESDAADFNVIITDIYGKVVYSGVRSSNVNVQNLNSGIYFVKISGTDFSKTVKIIKD
ncbi:MAG: PKD domain-containing protein [Bacteroidetes bacterium]|nr:PKD domain-containing protein [Bacteroidota bacterium]